MKIQSAEVKTWSNLLCLGIIAAITYFDKISYVTQGHSEDTKLSYDIKRANDYINSFF